MFKGLEKLGDLGALMKHARGIQENIQKIQDEIADLETEGDAGGGLVRVRIKGRNTLISLEIDPSILRADSKEIAEDLILSAVNNALAHAHERAQTRLNEAGAGLGLPSDFQSMF